MTGPNGEILFIRFSKVVFRVSINWTYESVGIVQNNREFKISFTYTCMTFNMTNCAIQVSPVYALRYESNETVYVTRSGRKLGYVLVPIPIYHKKEYTEQIFLHLLLINTQDLPSEGSSIDYVRVPRGRGLI